MDPIRRRNIRRPASVDRTNQTEGAQSVQKTDSNFTVEPPAAPPPKTGPSPAGEGRPRFEALRQRIQKAIAESNNKAEVLEKVVQGQLDEEFGPNASKGLDKKIAESFKNDPHLSALFDELYLQATGHNRQDP
jgi:hypothetical protein